MQMEEEIALVLADQTHLINQIKRSQKAINNLSSIAKQTENSLHLKVKRKEQIIKALQASLKKIAADKKKLEQEPQNTHSAKRDTELLSEMKKVMKENADLKETIERLNSNERNNERNEDESQIATLTDKLKRKAKKIRNLKLLLADYAEDEIYADDPDEKDGTPDVVDDAEDIEMQDAKELLEESESEEYEDPEDSDFDPANPDKGEFEEIDDEMKEPEAKDEDINENDDEADE